MIKTARDLYDQLGTKTASDDVVIAIDENGTVYSIIEVVREDFPNSNETKCLIRLESAR